MKNEISNAFFSNSRPENFRPDGYLGMSMIGGCEAAAYDSFMGSREADARLTWYGFIGSAIEEGIRQLFAVSPDYTVLPKGHYMHDIEAGFDSRFRGHADIILKTATNTIVVDVKSITWNNYKSLLSKIPPSAHWKNMYQVHAYIRHGGFSGGYIIYTPREIPFGAWKEDQLGCEGIAMPFYSVEVNPLDSTAGKALDDKARWLLQLIDNAIRPQCTCGYCKSSEDDIPF